MSSGADLERPKLNITLDSLVLELAANQALGIKHGVDGVHGNLNREQQCHANQCEVLPHIDSCKARDGEG